jgi:membrane protein YdbS with pleckstrin-like domain
MLRTEKMSEVREQSGLLVVEDDRREGERRAEERRQELRRDQDRRNRRLYNIRAAVWAILGAGVVLYLFLLAVGGINPDNARVVTAAVAVVAVVWVVHAWRRLWSGGYSSRADRERRGF